MGRTGGKSLLVPNSNLSLTSSFDQCVGRLGDDPLCSTLLSCCNVYNKKK